jgi:C4-dicarboxylate-specific signal transduction histidine kinase
VDRRARLVRSGFGRKTSEWLLHPNDREKTRAELTRLAEGHRTLRFENRLRDKDGTYHWLSWMAAPDRGLIYAVARDVTDLRNTERKLHETQAELQRVSRLNTISEITASIAHEIRQPLAAVRTDGDTCIRWLSTQPPHLEKASATAARISENAHRASEIIDRIQALFRKTEPALSWLNINDVINDVVVLLRGEMRYRDVLLSVELQADLSPVLADRVQLQQVMLNLMMNGAEAMSEVSERPRTLLVKSEAESTGAVVVSVEDFASTTQQK